MAGGESVLYAEQLAEFLSRQPGPTRQLLEIDTFQCVHRLPFQIGGDPVGSRNRMRAPEGLKAHAFDRPTVHLNLKPNPQCEAAILSSPRNHV